MSDALQTELETYKSELKNLLSEQKGGKFVLINDSKVVDTFSSYEDALKAGYQTFGLKPFLVKQIEPMDNIQYFTRDVTCRT